MLTTADQARLGGSFQAAYAACGHAVEMFRRVRDRTYRQAVVEVGTALHMVRPTAGEELLGAYGESLRGGPDAAVLRARRPGTLVVREHPRQVFWDRRQLPVDWDRHPAPWAFLLELARRALAGQPLDLKALGREEQRGPDHVRKVKRRLVQLLEPHTDPRKLIKRAGRGSFQLLLTRDKIRVFVLGDDGDTVREWTPDGE